MKDKLLKTYLLGLGVIAIISLDSTVSENAFRMFNDEARLKFHYSLNNHTDTSIVLLNSRGYHSDTIRMWVHEVLKYKPKVLAIDLFYDSLVNIELHDGSVIISVMAEDEAEVPLRYSANNFTTRETYGVTSFHNYFEMEKLFNDHDDHVPSIALAIVKEVNSGVFEDVIGTSGPEYINYHPTESFRVLELEDSAWTIDGAIKDKIVILGHVGYNNRDNNYVPGRLDYEDAHYSPIGKIYGPVIIASEVHTLLNDRIWATRKLLTAMAAVIILLGSFYATCNLRISGRVAHLATTNITLIVILILLSILMTTLMHQFRVFISIEMISLAIVFGSQAGILFRLATFKGLSRDHQQ